MEESLALLCKLTQRFRIINKLTSSQGIRGTFYLSSICGTKALISAHITCSMHVKIFD